MKVIKEGKKIKGIMRVTCKTCEAELEIQAGDLEKSTVNRSLFGPKTYYYRCPCCRRINYLRYRDLSKEIIFDLNDEVEVENLFDFDN